MHSCKNEYPCSLVLSHLCAKPGASDNKGQRRTSHTPETAPVSAQQESPRGLLSHGLHSQQTQQAERAGQESQASLTALQEQQLT